MSYSFSFNRDQVITLAYRLAGIIGEGETPSATQVTDASNLLNILVKNWEVTGLPLWAIRKQQMSFIANKEQYNTVSDLAMSEKPMKFLQAYVHDNTSNSDIPVQIITRDEYLRLGNKKSTGIPTQVWYVPNRTDGTITIYPSPSSDAVSNKVLIFYYQGQFSDLTAGTDIPDFPTEWIRPLAFQLASDLGDTNAINDNRKKWLETKSQILKEEVLGYGMEEGSVFFSPDRVLFKN